MSFTYKYPRPALTVDSLIFFKDNSDIKILLIQRGNPPFKNSWAFPGGFVEMHETLKNAASRELYEEAGVQNIDLKQLYTFDAIDRDPRHRTISVVFYGFSKSLDIEIKAGDDAKNVAWYSLNNLPELAFDHKEILEFAIKKLRLNK